ncbi:peptide deformylase [Patescibacteria group bacterium]|nr:peptide deformylase [Patescibacteria group bacterium]
MIRKVLINPDPTLRKISRKVNLDKIKSKEIQAFVSDLTETMIKKDGIGLAAPQIGQTVRIFVISLKDGVMEFINPEIKKRSWRKEMGEEGCLSIPGIYGLVKRNISIVVEAYNKEGEKMKISANGLMARVIQHETDHLDGILFIDKVKKFTKTEQQKDESKQ